MLTFVQCSLAVVIGQVPLKCIAWMIAPTRIFRFLLNAPFGVRPEFDLLIHRDVLAEFISRSYAKHSAEGARRPMSNLQPVRFFISYLRKMQILRANYVDLFWVNRMEDTS